MTCIISVSLSMVFSRVGLAGRWNLRVKNLAARSCRVTLIAKTERIVFFYFFSVCNWHSSITPLHTHSSSHGTWTKKLFKRRVWIEWVILFKESTVDLRAKISTLIFGCNLSYSVLAIWSTHVFFYNLCYCIKQELKHQIVYFNLSLHLKLIRS